MLEEISELKNNIISINNEFRNKFRLPIVLTYSIILIVYNWEIIFYLLTSKSGSLYKIDFVKNHYFSNDYHRIWMPLLLSVFYSLLFPIIQLILNSVIRYIKKVNDFINRKEELDNAKHKFNLQQQLSGKQTLQQLQNKIDQLLLENKELINTNQSLIDQLKKENDLTIDSEGIYKTEYENASKVILNDFNSLNNDSKTTFLDLMRILQNYESSFKIHDIENWTLFPKNIPKILEILLRNKILHKNEYSEYYSTTNFGRKLSQYFLNTYIK